MMKHFDEQNRWFFGLGAIGRDIPYTLVSMYLMVYITEVRTVSNTTLAGMTLLLIVLRSFDAFNDPLTGLIVDHTHSRFGKHKPWILIGAVIGGVCTVLMFADFGLHGMGYIISFGIIYVVWDLFYGLNEIAYWSMLPDLSDDQQKREKTGSFALICKNIGMLIATAGMLPFTNALSNMAGDKQIGWLIFISAAVMLMLGFSLFPLLGVTESETQSREKTRTPFRETFRAVICNDQLLWVALSMLLCIIGFTTTLAFGVYYFKYAYGDEAMFSVFMIVVSITQIIAPGIFLWLRRHSKRSSVFTLLTVVVLTGYILFFIAPMDMAVILAATVLIFTGQGCIHVLMLMLLADVVEYGEWKFGRRYEGVTFSIQPFVHKIGGAIGNGILGTTLIISGINAAQSKTDISISMEGILSMKVAMLIIPLVCIAAGYAVYMKKFSIDETRFQQIVADLGNGKNSKTTDTNIQ